MTIVEALKLSGLAENFKLDSAQNHEIFLQSNKRHIVEARRMADALRIAGNKEGERKWEFEAARISEARERLRKIWPKKQKRTCGCGRGKTEHQDKCRICRRVGLTLSEQRFATAQIETLVGKVEDGVTIDDEQACRQNPLRDAMLGLKEVGMSFVTTCFHSTIMRAQKRHDVKVIVRQIAVNRATKRRTYRVWRSDGLSWEEINRIIEQRKSRAS